MLCPYDRINQLGVRILRVLFLSDKNPTRRDTALLCPPLALAYAVGGRSLLVGDIFGFSGHSNAVSLRYDKSVLNQNLDGSIPVI